MELGHRYHNDGLYDKAAAMYEAANKLDPLNFSIFMDMKALEMSRGADSGEK